MNTIRRHVKTALTRRTVLRGMLGGAAINVALPLLNCFLNENGTALASGAPLPLRFGTWYWGCGMNPQLWVPKQVGADYDLPPELAPIKPFKNHVSVLSSYKVALDGYSNFGHISGNWVLRTGAAPAREDEIPAPTFDVLIGDAIGSGTRFHSLELAATGNPQHSYSARNSSIKNPGTASAVELYTRVFGAGFQDPNAAEFKPDPSIMLQKSVLSAVAEHRAGFMKQVGSEDRARLDEYFTSLRQAEQQLELQLQKPPRAQACSIPPKPADIVPVGVEITQVIANHKLMADLLAMALACNQTKVFNMVFSDSPSSLRKAGSAMTHHLLTHEEPVDKELGYQRESSFFNYQSMVAWAAFLQAMSNIREGSGTLLDNMLIVAHSDTQLAKTHSIDGIPVMIAGKAGGRLRSGVHVAGHGAPITSIGLTVQQVMGLTVESWGTKSNQTSKPVADILA